MLKGGECERYRLVHGISSTYNQQLVRPAALPINSPPPPCDHLMSTHTSSPGAITAEAGGGRGEESKFRL